MNKTIITILATGLALATGCDRAAEADPIINRCDAAAKKVAQLWGGDENAVAATYKSTVMSCTPGPDQELSELGETFLICIEGASTGAAVHRCDLDFEHDRKEKAFTDFADRFEQVYRSVFCGVVSKEKEEAVIEEVSELEREALSAGHEQEKIAKEMEKIRVRVEKKGCEK